MDADNDDPGTGIYLLLADQAHACEIGDSESGNYTSEHVQLPGTQLPGHEKIKQYNADSCNQYNGGYSVGAPYIDGGIGF
jgi:hypothetical protein